MFILIIFIIQWRRWDEKEGRNARIFFLPPLGAPPGTVQGYKEQQLWWGWMNTEWLIHKILKDFVPPSGSGSRRDARTFQGVMVYPDLPKGWILLRRACERRNSACFNSPVSSLVLGSLLMPACASCLFVWHYFCNGKPDVCEGKALDRSHPPTFFFWDWTERVVTGNCNGNKTDGKWFVTVLGSSEFRRIQ